MHRQHKRWQCVKSTEFVKHIECSWHLLFFVRLLEQLLSLTIKETKCFDFFTLDMANSDVYDSDKGKINYRNESNLKGKTSIGKSFKKYENSEWLSILDVGS